MARLRSLALLTAVLFAAGSGRAFAHASERGHVLLLPTGYYLAGGVAAVVASFLALTLVPAGFLDKVARRRLWLFSLPVNARAVVSLLSFLFFAALVLAGFIGSRDPLSNPLPLFVWTLLWVGLTLVSGLIGNVWHWINPWYGPWRLVLALSGGAGKRLPLLRLPRALGQWPAVATLAAFAWFELVDPAPDDPTRLAAIVSIYWLSTFAGILLFGYGSWTLRVDFLSHFFAVISHLSIVGTRSDGDRRHLFLRLPGARAADASPRPPGGVAFLLLSLASVSFDGFMRTFTWLGWIGVNPLEFPGRTALILPDTIGLIGMFLVLSAVFLSAVFLGERIVGGRDTARAASLLIWSIVPISLAYHFAHYLSALLVNGQYFWVALSDPFGRGWNWLGAAHDHIHAGVVLGAEAAWMLWNVQAFAIILGHVLAVAIAHLIAFRMHGSSRKATLSQVPLALLMVGYTLFGLWLLSTPSAG
jgi:hypothetical protein